MRAPDFPLVTCIMPTRDRRQFVPQAIYWFLQQDYPHRELVIADDGSDPVEDLIPENERIRYIRLPQITTLGEKRNIACEAARGSIIAHWDDDDWMAPWRLHRQVTRLLASEADLCGLEKLPFVNVNTGAAWIYRYRGRIPWVAGGTMCYRRRFWKKNPFASVNVGEDTRFAWRAAADQILVLNEPGMYVARIHEGCSSRKRTNSSRWIPQPLASVQQILGDGWSIFCGEAPVPPINFCDSSPLVTVSIPCYGSNETIRAAVDSILSQTYPHLRAVVVNDGDPDPPWDVLADIDDPRLTRFDLTRNRGRYFADAVVLEASPDPFFMIQDADDVSEPERVEKLLSALLSEGADVSIAASFKTSDERPGERSIETFPLMRRPLTADFEHRVNHHAALFRSEALRRIGGYYHGFRIGSDTLLMNLLFMTARAVFCDTPLYTYYMRQGSLVSAEETSYSSPARRRAWEGLEQLYRAAFDLYGLYVDGRIRRDTLAELIRQTIVQAVRDEDRIELNREAQRLRKAMGVAVRDEAFLRRDVPGVETLLSDASVPWSGWTISKSLARAVTERLEVRRPVRILETGSGTSTLFLGRYAAGQGASVVSLEHEPVFFEQTRDMLARFDLSPFVDLQFAPVVDTDVPGGRAPWYRTKLHGRFDFVFADGPPLSIGRQGVLHMVVPHLSDDWEFWLKDGSRAHEKECLEGWSRHHRFSCEYSTADPRGVWMLRPERARAEALSVGVVGDAPLVSCLMPTFNRRPFVDRAIEYFFRQDYERRELIIVDDGTDSVEDLIPEDRRVRYLRLDQRRTTGAKRNIAAEAARGAILLCWDDDDWYAPDRISYQVQPIVNGRADATALGRSLLYCIPTAQFWQATPRVHARMFYQQVVGGTLAFRKRDWEGARFPNQSLAEDAALLRLLLRRGTRLAKLPCNDSFVYVRHDANSWRFVEGRFIDRGGWTALPPPSFMPADDLAFYRRLRDLPEAVAQTTA